MIRLGIFFLIIVYSGLYIVNCSSDNRKEDKRDAIYIESDKKSQTIKYNSKNNKEVSINIPKKSLNKKKKLHKTPKNNADKIVYFDLRQLIEYLLMHNPALRGAETRIKSSLEFENQSDKTFQLNPMIMGGVGFMQLPTGMRGLVYEIRLTQPFEVGGQQSARRKIGKYKRRIAEDQLFTLRMKLLMRIKFLYYKGLVLNRKMESMKEIKKFFDGILNVTYESHSERYITDQRALFIQILYNSFMNSYDKTKEQIDNNLYEIKAIMNYKQPNPMEIKGKITQNPIPLNEKQLNDIAKNSRMDLLLRYNQIHIKDGQIKMEKSKRFPKIDVFISYRREMLNQMYMAGIAFPLPILNANSGNINAQEEEKNAIQEEINAIMFNVKQEIFIALRKMEYSLLKIRRYRKSIMKDSKRTRNLIKQYYSQGGVDFIKLLQQEKIYQEVIISYWTSVLDYYSALFTLEQTIGRIFLHKNIIGNKKIDSNEPKLKNKLSNPNINKGDIYEKK